VKIIPENIIKEIAEELEIGMFRVYINKKTLKVISIPDEDSFIEDDILEEYKKDEEEINKHEEDYAEIYKPDDKQSFRVMEAFAESIDDEKTKERFLYALGMLKPFRNFKYELDFYDELKDKWFKFKFQKLMEAVKEELDFIINGDSDS